jgi:hypothetical protein
MKRFMFFWGLLLLVLSSSQVWADEKLRLQKVVENVYAIVGDLGNRTADNLGNNATFGFVVTTEGVVLIDSGGTYLGAQKIEQLIETVTDKAVVTVINSGGQDHRWLGNGYFKKLGAQIIASEDAVTDQKARTQDQFFILGNLVGDQGIRGTDAVYAETTFKEQFDFKKGDTIFNIRHSGQAHTPGVERILGVGAQSNSKTWIDAFQAMATYNPEYLIPGHGETTNLSQAKKDTYDYLVFLRQSVFDFMENGGDLTEISRVDQSKFNYLLNYENLSGRNAQQVFTEIEWE